MEMDKVDINDRESFILQYFLPYRMVNLATRLSDACSTIYDREFGVTMPQWRVLAQLGGQSGLTSKALVELTSMDKSKVSRALGQLASKGYLCKKRDKRDHRVYYLSLTNAGLQLYQSITPKVLAWEAQLLEGIDVGEYRELLRIMSKLDKHLDHMSI